MVRRTPQIHVTQFITGAYEIHVPPGLGEEFRELVQRATNLWPDASPAIKAFADQVTSGKLMQDYSSPAVTAQPKK